MLIIMNKCTHEEHLSQPLQINKKQFKIAVTFLTAYNCFFNITNSNDKFHFTKTISDEDGYIQISISPGAYEIESLNNEIRRNFLDKKYFTKSDYHLKSNQISQH